MTETSLALRAGVGTGGYDKGAFAANGSPAPAYGDRINQLSDRLANLQTGLQCERNTRFDSLHSSMQGVDARLQASHQQLSSSYGTVRENLVNFQQMFDEERNARQESQDCKAQEFAAIDQRLQVALEEEQRALREVEGKALRSFDERAKQLREDVMRQDSQSTAEAEAAIRRYIDVDIPKLYESLREETRGRESMEDRIVKRASEEINRLQEGVLSEKKAREDTEAAVLRVMEDTVAKMRAEIAQERADREATEETLLKLLESTCNKLHVASQTL